MRNVLHYKKIDSMGDFRGEISLMGEIKGNPNFYWAIFYIGVVF